MVAKLPVDADPRRKAYSRICCLARKGMTRAEIEADCPITIRLAREWEAKRRMERYYEKRDRWAQLSHIDKLSWIEVMDQVRSYWQMVRDKIPGITKADKEILREFEVYYARVTHKDKLKQMQHPDIPGQRLGIDPRHRDWPSGRIEFTRLYRPKPGVARYKARVKAAKRGKTEC